MDLFEELQMRVVCGDGAIGTLLLEAGVSLERCFEELCVTEPERIAKIHREYIAAGARVIETNSFGANAVRLAKFGLEGRVEKINQAAAQIACRAARGKDVYVAGSVGPLGINREDAVVRGIDRTLCFREQIRGLLEGGVDLIFFETFMDFEEMEIALQARKEAGAGAGICSFTCDPEGRLSSGMLLEEAFSKLCARGEEIVGVNCVNGPGGVAQLLRRASSEYVVAAYPNAGVPKIHEGRAVYHSTPGDFAQSAREMVAAGARLVGGCCGTTPKHISAIAATIAKSQ